MLQVLRLPSHDAAKSNAGPKKHPETANAKDNHTNEGDVETPNKGQLMCAELTQRKR